MDMVDCLFCKIVAGDIPCQLIHEEEDFIVFKDINPKADIHWLFVPRHHFISLADLKTPKEVELLNTIMSAIPKLAKQHDIPGFRTIINTGAQGGQEIDHFHAHLLAGKHLPGF